MHLFGDNGIISNAQQASFKSGMAVLEEFLQEKYVENYDKFNNDESKVVQLQNLYPEYFYIPVNEGIGVLRYVVDNSDHALYLIKKSELPNEVKNCLVGGDAGDKTYADYSRLNDVYGVTSDLKVYYANGIDKNGELALYGLTISELDNDNPFREVLNKDKNLDLYNIIADYDKEDINGNKDGIITAEEIKSVKSLKITEDLGITSLAELYNFTNLKELTLDSINLANLDGIDNIPYLNYLCFKNYGNKKATISDYSKLSKTKNLQHLYLENSCDEEVNKVFESMKDAEYKNLKYLGIRNSTDRVTNILPLKNLTRRNKKQC